MILDFSKIEETVKTQFYGGEKELRAHMNIDKNNKIIGHIRTRRFHWSAYP